MRTNSLAILAASLALAACTVPASNPLDPKAPLTEQAKASVTGTIVLLDDGASVTGATVGLLDAALKPVRGADGQLLQAAVEGTDARGSFTLAGIQPGRYTLTFGVDPRFRPPFVPEITLAPGDERSVGELVFTVLETGTGMLRGRAALVDAAGGARTIGVFRRRDGRPPELVRQLTTDANGAFEADALPPGTYAVSAEATGFFPDFSAGHTLQPSTPGALTSNEIVLLGDDELRLYPATAVLVPDLPRKAATYFTNADALDLLVIPTVVDAWVTDMRLSADRAFQAQDGEIDFDAFRQRATVNLPDREGAVALYGQFRAKAGDFDFTTDVFETQVVRDVTPPAFVSTGLRGIPSVGGIAWLREDGATVTVEIQANDVASAVSAYGVYSDPTNDPGTAEVVTFRDVSLPPGFVRIDHTTQLLPGQGPRVLGLWLRDNAGNVSGPERLEVVVDSEPPALVGPLKVVNADQHAQLAGRLASLKVPVEEACLDHDAPPGLCAVEFRYGTAPLPTAGFFSPFVLGADGTVVVPVTGGNGQSVGFEVQLRDAAGNVATYTSELYTLRLLGQLSGRALVDGYPDDAPAHGGALVSLFEPGSDRSTPVATGLTADDGRFVLRTADGASDRLPAGHYIVVVTRGDLEPFETETSVRENEAAVLPAYRLTPARGFLRGRFVRADQVGSARAHANIEVTASRNGIAVARTVTADDGSFSFPAPGLPVTVGGERYTLLASASGYAARRVEGLEVFRAQTTVVEPDGETPPQPQPVELARLAGDFVFCESLSGECLPTPYANQETVRIKLLEATGVSEIRFRARTPFDASAETPEWVPFDADTPYVVPIAEPSDPDGNVAVYVQTRVAGSAGPVLSASVLLDRTAPPVTSFEIEPGPNALPGFTSKPTVRVVVGAEAGTGEVAPLQTALVAFASAPPSVPPAGAVACFFGAACTIPLPATAGVITEGMHEAYAFACDRAGNCSDLPSVALVVYDVTPPRQANGLAFEPSATWITKADGVWYSRAGRVDVGLDVGTAKTPGGAVVISPDGASVPDVVAYRFGLRMDVSDGAWRTLSDVTQPEAHVTTQALEITGDDGRYDVYGQFRDAAGNVTEVEANPRTFAITIDRLPPAVAFSVNDGAEWTNDPALQLAVTTAAGDLGPARDVMLSLDGGLFETFDRRTLPLVGSNAVYTLPSTDGSHSLYARFTDAAGNVSERVARIFLDRTAPRIVSLRCGTCREDPATGTLYTNAASRQVVLDLIASDNSGAIASVTTQVGASPASSGAYIGTVTATLADVDGPQPIRLQVTDPAGNVSEERSLTVVLDRSPPAIVMSLNEDREHTTSASVVVGITSTDGSALSGLRISNTATFSGPVQAFAARVPWTLSSPTEDGPRTVYVEVTDPAGNVTTASDTIVLDSHPPLAPTLVITSPTPIGETQAITSANITLRISTSDGSRPLEGAAVLLEGDVALPGGSTGWLGVGTAGLAFVNGHFEWTGALSATEGPKQLLVRVRDAAGNVSDASIVRALLRTTAPSGASASLSPSPLTASTTGRVSLSAHGATAFRLSGDLASVDGVPSQVNAWLPFAASVPVTFTTGDGVKNVSISFRNEALQETPPILATTTLDTTAPTGTLTIVGAVDAGATSTTLTGTRAVTLSLSATDAGSGVASMRLADTSAALASAPWVAYSPSVAWSLPAGDGTRTVFLQLKDVVGNEGPVVSGSTTLDQTPPSAPRFASLPAAQGEPLLSLELGTAAVDALSGTVRYEWLTPELSAWTTVTFPASFTLSGNRSHSFLLRAVDGAGNVSAEDVATVVHDDVAPPAPTVVTPSLYVAAQTTSVTLTGGETDVNFSHYEACTYVVGAWGDCPQWGDCAYARSPASFALSLAANENTCLLARSVDVAGNASDGVWTKILSDTTRPVPPVIGPAVTRDSLVVQAQEVEVFVQMPAYDPPLGEDAYSSPWANVAFLEFGTAGSFAPVCPATRKDDRWAPCDPDATGGRCTDPRLRCRGTEVSSVVLPLADGTVNTLSARAVDLAGNVSDAVSVEVLTAGARQLTALPDEERSAVLFGNTLAYRWLVGSKGRLIELGSNRALDSNDAQCELDVTGDRVLSVGRPGAAHFSYPDVKLRRRGADGVFCSADDDTILLASVPNSVNHLTVGGETVGWAEIDYEGGCYPVMLREPGPDGLLNGVGDVTVPLGYSTRDWYFTISDTLGLQIAEDALILRQDTCAADPRDGSWVLVQRRQAGGAWTFAGGPAWAFRAVDAALSPDGRFLATIGTDYNSLTVREKGEDGLFGTADDRVTTRTSPHYLGSIRTDGLRIVGWTDPWGDPTYYLFTWSPGLDAVYQTAEDPLSDDAVSFMAPTSTSRHGMTVSTGLVVYTEYDNLKIIDLARLRWETGERGAVATPFITNGGLVYIKESKIAVKQGADETPAPFEGTPFVHIDSFARSILASGDDAVYVVYNTDSQRREIHGRRRAPGGRAFGAADRIQRLILADEYDHPLPVALGDGRALLFTGTIEASTPVVVEPGAEGLADGSLASAPGTPMYRWAAEGGISRHLAVWTDGNGQVHIWQAGADGRFGTGDDVAPAPLHQAPALSSGYWTSRLAQAGSRIALTNGGWNHLRVIEPGADKLFNTADDRNLDVPLPPLGMVAATELALAGNYMAWVRADPETGVDQVFLYDFLTNATTRVTSHQSKKTDLQLSESGRLVWVDSLFPHKAVFSFVP